MPGSGPRLRGPYARVALALGVVWLGALAIPPGTRDIIFRDLGRGRMGWPLFWLALLCGVSAALALLFRRRIVGAGRVQAAVQAVALPLVGALLVVGACFVVMVMRGIIEPEAYPTVLSVGLRTTASAWYVVIPMGLLSQWVMSRSGRYEDAGSRRGAAPVT